MPEPDRGEGENARAGAEIENPPGGVRQGFEGAEHALCRGMLARAEGKPRIEPDLDPPVGARRRKMGGADEEAPPHLLRGEGAEVAGKPARARQAEPLDPGLLATHRPGERKGEIEGSLRPLLREGLHLPRPVLIAACGRIIEAETAHAPAMGVERGLEDLRRRRAERGKPEGLYRLLGPLERSPLGRSLPGRGPGSGGAAAGRRERVHFVQSDFVQPERGAFSRKEAGRSRSAPGGGRSGRRRHRPVPHGRRAPFLRRRFRASPGSLPRTLAP